MVFLVFSLSFCRCGGGSFGQRIIPCKPIFKNKTNNDQKRKRPLHFGFVRRVWNSFLVNCFCFHISFLTELAVVLLIWWFFVRFFANWELAPKKVCLCKMESIIEGMSLFFFFSETVLWHVCIEIFGLYQSFLESQLPLMYEFKWS